jgi:hypothetical protein
MLVKLITPKRKVLTRQSGLTDRKGYETVKGISLNEDCALTGLHWDDARWALQAVTVRPALGRASPWALD